MIEIKLAYVIENYTVQFKNEIIEILKYGPKTLEELLMELKKTGKHNFLEKVELENFLLENNFSNKLILVNNKIQKVWI